MYIEESYIIYNLMYFKCITQATKSCERCAPALENFIKNLGFLSEYLRRNRLEMVRDHRKDEREEDGSIHVKGRYRQALLVRK